MTHYRVYTGPTLVQEAARRLEAAFLHVTLRGTEHVYVEAPNEAAVLTALNEPHKSGWTWRDLHVCGGDR